MNAFFTLGITKLFGSLLSFITRNDAQLLPMAFGLLLTHQYCLSFGPLSGIVMEDYFPRTSLLAANREGIFSLPGYFAIYLLSMCLSQWLQADTLLSYQEMKRKLRQMFLLSLTCWLLMAAANRVVGVSRVTCNLGYVIWMFAISITMISLTIFIFDFVIDSVMTDPIIGTDKYLNKLEGTKGIPTFTICEALNMNGLTFFLLANSLLGGIKYYLRPKDRNDYESVGIIFIYMLLSTVAICQLHRKGIRLA
ncbi:phosphatidylinositol-glycan biosynthesis class W protein-like isoform X2 [Drosophila hydei]|nr:phosphatidylinositol-glycan biosynthesis class W protein-like isoform X2 [Drosophila hydei]